MWDHPQAELGEMPSDDKRHVVIGTGCNEVFSALGLKLS